jgi:hypothetical protein
MMMPFPLTVWRCRCGDIPMDGENAGRDICVRCGAVRRQVTVVAQPRPFPKP